MLLVVEGQSAVGGADDDADPAAVPDGRVESGVGDGLTGGDDGELGESVHQPLGCHPEDRCRVAVGDGVEEVAGQTVQFGPGADGRHEALGDAVPGGVRSRTGRGDQADAGDGGGERGERRPPVGPAGGRAHAETFP